MAITVDNSLSGPSGVQPSASSISSTARTGTVTLSDPARAVYSATEVVRSLTTMEVDTGHHRAGGTSGDGIATPRMSVDLPAPPWTVRFYARIPSLRAAGNGGREVRWVARMGDYGIHVAEQSNNNIIIYLESVDLSQVRNSYDSASGSWFPLDQWIRYEVSYDGTDVAVSLYAAHNSTPEVTLTWVGYTLNASTAEITGYRYRDAVLLVRGDNDADFGGTPIEDRQNQILAWNQDALPTWGADGDYGAETEEWVGNFQSAHGLPVDGSRIGPETGAALDLAQQIANATAQPPPMYLSHLAVSDTSSVGPADTPSGTAHGALTADGIQSATRQALGSAAASSSVGASSSGSTSRAGTAAAGAGVSTAAGGSTTRAGSSVAALGVAPAAAGAKSVGGTATADVLVDSAVEGAQAASATAPLTVGAAAAGTKQVAESVSAGIGVGATAVGYKRTAGTAEAGLLVDGTAVQVIEPIPGILGAASVVGQLAGGAAATERLGGNITPLGRLGGTAERI